MTDAGVRPLGGAERAKIAVLYGLLAAATLLSFAEAALIGQTYALLGSLAVLAFTLGIRHGLDVDHIAAIDNVTRRLMREGKRSLTVGTWFSLGHSTVVFVLIVALLYLRQTVVTAFPLLENLGSMFGTAASGLFLWAIGAANVVVVIETYRVFSSLRKGVPAAKAEEMNKQGLFNRRFGGLFQRVQKPWETYAIGMLFGLGFDTASEVALLVLSLGAGFSVGGAPWAALTLPALFGCGMVIVDTSDGLLMSVLYGWSFLKPVRKVYYNLTVTVISVGVAFLVGTVEILQATFTALNLQGGIWDWLGGLNFETMGVAVVAIFLGAWVVALGFYRYKGFEETAAPTTTMTA